MSDLPIFIYSTLNSNLLAAGKGTSGADSVGTTGLDHSTDIELDEDESDGLEPVASGSGLAPHTNSSGSANSKSHRYVLVTILSQTHCVSGLNMQAGSNSSNVSFRLH